MPYPKKPTPLKILQGTDRADRRNKNEPKPKPAIPDPPEHLSEYAKKEWDKITKILLPLGLLTDLDAAALAGYCQAYGRWRLAEEELEKSPGLVIKTISGNYIQNPLVGIANKAMEHLRKFITMFGLSPADRSRVSVEKQKQSENRFEKFK
jgi:P27 family predicted phage terminase small subunit